MMKIAIGSTNPVKIEAVRQMAAQIWTAVDLCPVSVDSGVSAMPLTDAETLEGARQRAMASLTAVPLAQLGLGLEGGVQQMGDTLFLQGWVVAVDGNGRCGVGGCPRLTLPQSVAQRILAGAELGPLMDELTSQANMKQKEGAVGVFTNGLVKRQEAFAVAVAYALAPFVTPQFYFEIPQKREDTF